MAKLTVDPHRVKHVHIIPLDCETGEHERREPDSKRVKWPLEKNTLTLLEKQGLQALLTLHSDIRPLQRQDVDQREDQFSTKGRCGKEIRSKSPAGKESFDSVENRSKTMSSVKTPIRFLGDPLALPNPPPFPALPLGLPPPLPRIPYGCTFPAKPEPSLEKKISQSAEML